MENVFWLNGAEALADKTAVALDGERFLIYQFSLSSEIRYGREIKVLSENEVFVGASPKECTVSTANEARAILLSVSGTLVSELFDLYEITEGFSAYAPEAAELFEELRLITEKKFYPEKERQREAAEVFHKLVYRLHKSSGTRLVRRTALRIKEYIDTHAEEKTELSELSKVFFMSKTQIHRLFKEEYGISPIRYLIDRKIDVSKKLLENESLKISEIADMLSFSDARHFSKTFFRRAGMLPSEYRKKKHSVI